jgi:hypothetical protein
MKEVDISALPEFFGPRNGYKKKAGLRSEIMPWVEFGVTSPGLASAVNFIM